MAANLLDAVSSGKIKVEVARSYPLAEAPEAHRAPEARETTGSVVFTM